MLLLMLRLHAGLIVDHGTVLTGIVTSSAGVEAININVSGILTTNNFRVTGVTTIAEHYDWCWFFFHENKYQ